MTRFVRFPPSRPKAVTADLAVARIPYGRAEAGARLIAVALVVTTVLTGRASAQRSGDSFQVGAQLTVARSGLFESTELGIGGRISWQPIATIGIEAEVDLYPADFPGDGVPFSTARLEGLLGVTAGPRFGRARPFAKIRAGALRYSPPTAGFACIAIFPPPLNCLMAAGGTRSIVDIGGGMEVFTGSRSFLRIDAGDRMVRLPAPTLVNGFTLRDAAFFSHDFRLSVGGGLRF